MLLRASRQRICLPATAVGIGNQQNCRPVERSPNAQIAVLMPPFPQAAGLALAGDSEMIAEFTWRCGQNHSVQLLPNLAFVLCQAKLSLTAASGIIVARGPGGYNGLRVGLSTAKSLAFCLNIPLAGIVL